MGICEPSNKKINEKKIYFPIGTIYEKELNLNFKYFNVFWYDPNNTNDFEYFEKCFENVQFCKNNDLNSSIDFFKKESIYEWIVITPGSKGKELISNLGNFECIKSFFIFCRNPDFHKWANNMKKVGCITSDPKILCQKFIDLNKNYIFPNFNFRSKTYNAYNDTILNLDNNNLEDNFDIKSSSVKFLVKSKNKLKNKYNILCVKLLNYLNGNEILNDMKEGLTDLKSPLITIPGIDLNLVIDILKDLCLLSFYFSKYPYLLNLLSFQEIKDILKNPNINFMLSDPLQESVRIGYLAEKIKKNECILDDKDILKELQIMFIYEIALQLKFSLGDSTIFINYYQIINYLRDFDFCLKLVISSQISAINNKKHNFIDEFYISLLSSEPRFHIYFIYLLSQMIRTDKFIKEEQNLINDSLTIKDYIILGDINFHEKIKPIEMLIKSKSFKYINLEQISDYLDNKKQQQGKNIWTYFYFLIIRFEEYQKYLENIILLSLNSGITFLVFLYIENEENRKIA